MQLLWFIVCLVIAFLLGSIPNGVLVGKYIYGIDIRERGSGNIGTTNALRALGGKAGALVFALDFGKGLVSGLIAAVIAAHVVQDAAAAGVFPSYKDFTAVAFFGCTLGHIFSPWLGFKGGKGIAVAVGCLFVTFGPLGACIELGVFGILVALSRYVSLGSVAAAVLCPFLALSYFWGDWLGWVLCATVGIVVLWAHRGNIERLIQGSERKLGEQE